MHGIDGHHIRMLKLRQRIDLGAGVGSDLQDHAPAGHRFLLGEKNAAERPLAQLGPQTETEEPASHVGKRGQSFGKPAGGRWVGLVDGLEHFSLLARCARTHEVRAEIGCRIVAIGLVNQGGMCHATRRIEETGVRFGGFLGLNPKICRWPIKCIEPVTASIFGDRGRFAGLLTQSVLLVGDLLYPLGVAEEIRESSLVVVEAVRFGFLVAVFEVDSHKFAQNREVKRIAPGWKKGFQVGLSVAVAGRFVSLDRLIDRGGRSLLTRFDHDPSAS